MIYSPLAPGPVTLRIPRTVAASPAEPRLELVCPADRQRYGIPVRECVAESLYYRVGLDFSPVKTPGEYEYRLTDGDALLASGLIRLGAAPASATVTFETAPTYEQFSI